MPARSIPARSSPRRVLVLGGSGFVGRNLVWRLARQGYRLRIPTRSRARSRELLVHPQLELVQADVHDAPTLERLLEGCDAAINLVGILNERGHDGAASSVPTWRSPRSSWTRAAAAAFRVCCR